MKSLKINLDLHITGLVLSIVTIPIVWLFLLDCSIFEFYSGNDAFLHILDLRSLLDVNVDWRRFLYRSELLGGSPAYSTFGIRKFFEIAQFLSNDVILIYNLYIIFFQAMIGYFSVLAVETFIRLRSDKYNLISFQQKICLKTSLIIIFAFTPIFGLRISHGHINPELISIPLLISTFLLIKKRELSLTHLLVLVLSLYCIFPPTGQLFIYCTFFSLFFYLFLSIDLYKSDNNKNYYIVSIILVMGIIFGITLSSLPAFVERYQFIKSTDAIRSINSENIVYSYTTHTIRDFVASISYILEPFKTRSDHFFLHETNYPMGAFLIFLFLFSFKKFKYLNFGLLTVFILTHAFAMKVPVLSQLIQTIYPPLKLFRVPARSLSIFVLIFLFLSVSQFLLASIQFQNKKNNLCLFTTLAISLSILFLPPFVREAIVWLLCIVFYILFKNKSYSRFPAHLLIILLASYSLSAFKERSISTKVKASTFAMAGQIKKALIKNHPDLKSPLVRAKINRAVLGSNTAYYLGLSSVDGYRLPTKDFLENTSLIMQTPPNETAINFSFNSYHKNYPILRLLYNIQYNVDVDFLTKNINISKFTENTNGPIWFPVRLKVLKDKFTFFNNLEKKSYTEIKSDLSTNVYVSAKNHETIQEIHSNYSQCDNSRYSLNISEFNNQDLAIKVNIIGKYCPMVVSSNYLEMLQATDQTTNKEIKIFKAYGSLIVLLLPRGSYQVLLSPKKPILDQSLYYAGLIISFLFILLLLIRQNAILKNNLKI